MVNVMVIVMMMMVILKMMKVMVIVKTMVKVMVMVKVVMIDEMKNVLLSFFENYIILREILLHLHIFIFVCNYA